MNVPVGGSYADRNPKVIIEAKNHLKNTLY
jgi:hypothetical protein